MIFEEKKDVISKEEFSRKLGEKRLLYDFLAIECIFKFYKNFFLKFIVIENND